MIYIFIQVVLNIIIFRFCPENVIVVYKKLAYIIYPILISALLVLPKHEIVWGNDGFALDITEVYSKSYVLTLILIIGIQFIFNNFLSKIISRRIEKSS